MVGGYLRTQAEVMLDGGRANTLVGYRRPLMIRTRSHQQSRARPRRILIVEDDLVIALMMEEIVREMGCAVSGIAGTPGMTRLQLAKRDFDAVLLDVNLDGEYNPETADLLLEMGVPFAFVTGYDYVVDPRHDNVPLCRSPSCPFNSEFSSSNWSVQYDQVMGRHRRPRAAACHTRRTKPSLKKQCRDVERGRGFWACVDLHQWSVARAF